MTYHSSIALDALWPGEMVGVDIEGVKVLLVNVDGTVHAYEDRCAHQAAQLSKGRLQGNLLVCPLHHWCYDVCSGQGVNPASARLKRFPTRIENEQIFVDVGQ